MSKEQEALDLLFKKMKEVPDEKLDETFIGALKFTPDQKNLVTFVFWLCYMTETDLESVLKQAWSLSSAPFSDEASQLAKKMISDNLKGYGEGGADIDSFITNLGIEVGKKQSLLEFINKNYSLKRVFTGVEDLPYFIDKIKIYELFFGKTKRTKLLYKINDIRNDLSHNKINELTYNGENLFLRTTKEKLIVDYFETAFHNEPSQSKILKDLTPEDWAKVEEMRKKLNI